MTFNGSQLQENPDVDIKGQNLGVICLCLNSEKENMVVGQMGNLCRERERERKQNRHIKNEIYNTGAHHLIFRKEEKVKD